MTYTITTNCISCQRCLSVCASNAIQSDGSTFWIEASRCNQCAETYGVPQCWAVCPTNEGCVPLTSGAVKLAASATADYWETWFATYNRMVTRLQATQPSRYWQTWFDTYAESLERLLHRDPLEAS